MILDRPEKSWFHRYIVYLLVASISILLFVNIFLIYTNSNIIRHNNGLQDQTELVKVNTLDIIRTIHQIDMGVRGYALIQSKLQRGVTLQGFDHLDTIFSRLDTLLGAQGFDMRQLTNVKEATHAYTDTVRHMIALIDSEQIPAFNALLKKDLGYLAFRSYDKFSDSVRAFEYQVASTAKHRYNLALRNAYLLQIVLFLFTVPAMFYMVFLFRKTLRVSEQLRKAEQDSVGILAKQKDDLESEVSLRTNEIRAQNDQIIAHNVQLVQQQQQIDLQSKSLTDKNHMLEEAYKTIEQQHFLISEKNKILTEEVNHQTQHLRKTNLELIEKNNRLEQFSHIISHNLRAPMARLVGLSSILPYSKNEQEKFDLIRLMVKSTEDLDGVIKDLTLLLSIQHLNTNVYSSIDLEFIVRKVRATLEHEIHETSATINVDLTAICTLYSLPQYVESIMLNLISNALKYRHPDRAPVIVVRTEKLSACTRVIVSDNGLGLDLTKYRDALFNLYRRFHFHVEGKGLGLYLVRTQVEALGGKIHVDSTLDQGTVFSVDFV